LRRVTELLLMVAWGFLDVFVRVLWAGIRDGLLSRTTFF
jgi:hypothetical protein